MTHFIPTILPISSLLLLRNMSVCVYIRLSYVFAASPPAGPKHMA